ncbi:hypothetical protein [Sphingomonas aracearum]|uniref:hypothetical protein n=1 Tax=Sphingomonas aracearum TaxID=2283317 RepID=UPI0011C01C6B|nr:hypothetical protein [Sphingomonas aracearum]
MGWLWKAKPKATTMHRFTSNPPSRRLPPRSDYLPSARQLSRFGKQTPTLIDRIEAFRRQHGMSEGALGKLLGNSNSLLDGLRAGRQPRPALLARIEAVLSGEASHA